MEVAETAALIATLLAACGALPQIVRIARTGDAAGVSLTAAALGVATELAWVVHGFHAGLWLVIPEAILMTATNAALALAVVRVGGLARVAILGGLCWGVVLMLATVANPSVAAAALGGAYLVQVTPAVWTAWRTTVPSGVSAATWIVMAIEALLWGVYGVVVGDPACISFGVIGTVASIAITARVLGVGRHRAAGRVPSVLVAELQCA